MALNRREFLKTTAASALLPGALFSTNRPASFRKHGAELLAQDEIDDLFKRAIVFDTLCVGREWNEVEFEAIEKSGYTGIQTTLPSSNFEVATRALAEWNQRIKDHPDKFIHAVTAADIERAKKEDKLAVIFGFQNATMLEDEVENLDPLYHLGTRCIQLTYNSRNLLGNGCTERVDGGLSDFGVEVVKRMNELGIIVDLSHCGRQTTMDGVQFSNPGACFTHTMCEAIYKNHPRAKTDAQIKAMAGKGGVIGIAALGYFVGQDPGGETTIENYLDHIDHAVKIAGLDHVGLCTDFQIQGISVWATRENWYEPRLRSFKPTYNVRWPPWIPELDAPERFLNVARGLDRRGYKTTEIEKMLGLNWMRYVKEIFGM
jgi:membrane dipeptidase